MLGWFLNAHGWFLGAKNSKNRFWVIWRHWPLMTWWFHDLISSLLSAKWMSESKSAPQITLEGSRTRKSLQSLLATFDLIWLRLACVGPDDLSNAWVLLGTRCPHSYHWQKRRCLHVMDHVACCTDRIFLLTWPQLWRHRSNVRRVMVLKFLGGRKTYGRKAI